MNWPQSDSVDKLELSADSLRRARASTNLSDRELTICLAGAAVIEQKALPVFLAYLAEFDRRRLYAELAHASLFSYATRVLGYSEDAAFKRIRAARAASCFPAILELLNAGEIHLTAVVILAPHLTADNHLELLDRARGKTKRELEFMAATLSPRAIEADCVRRVPEAPEPKEPPLAPAPAALVPQTASPPAAPKRIPPRELPPRIEPLSSQRVRFSFTGDVGLLRNIDRAKELLWHKHPDGRLEDIIEEILKVFLDKKDPDRRLARKAAKERRSLKP